MNASPTHCGQPRIRRASGNRPRTAAYGRKIGGWRQSSSTVGSGIGLSSHALRALQIVRETAEGQSGVSASRQDSIAHAVRQLAGMIDPDRRAQLERLEEQIAALTEQRRRAEDGTARGATVDEMRQQLNEILSWDARSGALQRGRGPLERVTAWASRAMNAAPAPWEGAAATTA
jgi:hypothetical protein